MSPDPLEEWRQEVLAAIAGIGLWYRAALILACYVWWIDWMGRKQGSGVPEAFLWLYVIAASG